ncbi:MAG: DF family (seleno)protein [Candidatus Acidiferrales bacterium]
MKIEVLYVPSCPNLPLAVQRVREAIALVNIRAEIQEIVVHDNSDAVRLEFPGSPTIRINDRDVEPAPVGAYDAGLQCRLYSGAQNSGAPSSESIVRALREAVREEAGQ